jgi:epoxyqueuosine reductase
MPSTMDFEAKYRAGDAAPFHQKNEMYKRVRWDNELKQLGRDYFGVVEPTDKPGFRHQEIAFRNASWFVEMGFARGVIETGFGLYDWDDRLFQMTAIPMDPPWEEETPSYHSLMVKKAAKFYGADLVGICRMDPRWVYTGGYELVKRHEFDIDISDDYTHVIVLGFAMSYEDYKYTPTFIGGAATGLGYSKMAYTAGLTAQFLRGLGYNAIPTGNDTALSVPYAIQAGMGELGRNGILITPKYGPRLRLAKIFTNLPMECDTPIDFGVAEFCERCNKCADNCPPRAISHGVRTTEAPNLSNAGGSLKWYVNGERCFKFWASNTCDCGNCVRVCPFNKPDGWLHDSSRWFIEKTSAFNKILVKIDDALGYGQQGDMATYWDRES